MVLSTDNSHKVKEIKDLLGDLNIDIKTKSDVLDAPLDVEETADTLEGNATLKTKALRDKTDEAVFADDTGLFVNSLGGEPGVHSARYAEAYDHDDAMNRKKLLERLGDATDRSAYFKTVISYIDKHGKEHLFEGICEGDIATEAHGEHGFGYDSLFIPKGMDKTFAELTESEKNAISHRGRALEKFKAFLMEQ
ncbi:RdgB/HAM1 family non-canonical purine NTP pyrophosphatase [Peptoniphilus equinus]|uniref:dITP/XTP pyrophosphatase n=1 Tax=Peptoniphilus equinus TaxID=3016343 RepID=A0ABY7QXU5_9FIRM|nr:RdgB/HAM1 family non-canonical purine NTP pyrophosphatase [Peptoniphilus equinus]